VGKLGTSLISALNEAAAYLDLEAQIESATIEYLDACLAFHLETDCAQYVAAIQWFLTREKYLEGLELENATKTRQVAV